MFLTQFSEQGAVMMILFLQAIRAGRSQFLTGIRNDQLLYWFSMLSLVQSRRK